MAKIPLASRWNEFGEELHIHSRIMQIVSAHMADLLAYHAPTADHCMRVGIMAAQVALFRGMPPQPLFFGGSMHDLGKLDVPLEKLTKTGSWTDDDRKALQNHPLDGYTRLKKDGLAITAALVVRHHTFQPNGYPAEVPEIPFFAPDTFLASARTIALVDYYDAAHRPNNEAMASGDAIKQKVLTHNPDEQQLVHDLYDAGVFDSKNRPY